MEDKERKAIEAARVIAEYADGIYDCHTCLFHKWCSHFYEPVGCVADLIDWVES